MRLGLALVVTSILLLAMTPTAVAAGTLTIDSNPSSSCVAANVGSGTVSCMISTSNTNDIIIVFVTTSSGTPGTPSGGSLTYNSRQTATTAGVSAAEFWADASSTLSGVTITDTISGGTTPTAIIIAFAVSGACTTCANPFDPNLSSAPTPGTGSTGAPTVTFTTTGTDDMILGLAGMSASEPLTAGTGFTQIQENSQTLQTAGAEYQGTTTTGSQTAAFSVTATVNWIDIGDALVSASGVPEFPVGILPLLLLVPVVYLILRTRSKSTPKVSLPRV